MKKKFKLFATIGSLALAICMMTIGVLAATTVTLNVSSNVSFNVSSVFATIDGSVVGGNSVNKTFTAKTYTGTTVGVDAVPVASDPVFTKGTNADFGDLSFIEGTEGQKLTYKFTITNDGEETCYFKFEEPTGVTTPLSGSAQYTGDVTSASGQLTSGQTVTLTYTLQLTNVSASLDATGVDFVITVSANTIA